MHRRRRRRNSRISQSSSFGPKGSGGMSLGPPADEVKWTRVVETSPAPGQVRPAESQESLWVHSPKIVDIPRRPPHAGELGYGNSISGQGSSRNNVSEILSMGSLRSTRTPPEATSGTANLSPLPDLSGGFDFGLQTESALGHSVSWSGISTKPNAERGASLNPEAFPIRDS